MPPKGKFPSSPSPARGSPSEAAPSAIRVVLLIFVLLLLSRCSSARCPLDDDSQHRSRSCERDRNESPSCTPGAPCEVRTAVLVPRNASAHEVALPLVLPALEIGRRAAARKGVWPEDKLHFFPRDDHCEAVYGQYASGRSFGDDCVHAFFGPTCEYSVAPVGRMVRFWNTPLLTVGALTSDFTEKKTDCSNEFHMLTRVGSLSFRDIANFFITIMQENKWKKVMLIYDKNGYSRLSGEHTCKLMMETVVRFLKARKLHFDAFDTEKSQHVGIKESLRQEPGHKYGGSYRPLDQIYMDSKQPDLPAPEL